MNTISSYPGQLAGYGRGSMAHTGSRHIRQESVAASRNQSMDLSVKTSEVDVVTINSLGGLTGTICVKSWGSLEILQGGQGI